MLKNEITKIANTILKIPGDEISARISDTGRKILKIKTNGGHTKCSVTQYPNGTIVKTQTIKYK